MATETSRAARIRRHVRVRKSVIGSNSRPRLSVFRSLQHIYVQVIDDLTGRTLVSASTISPELAGRGRVKKVDEAKLVGELIAKKALEKGVKRVVFDRGGWQYHGRIKAVAEGARKAGLEF